MGCLKSSSIIERRIHFESLVISIDWGASRAYVDLQ